MQTKRHTDNHLMLERLAKIHAKIKPELKTARL